MIDKAKEAGGKLWNKNYIFMLLVCILDSFSFYLISTILSVHLLDIGTGFSMTGFIVGMFSVTALVCRPICGIVADRMNQTFLLKLSNILMAAGLMGFAFVENVPLLILFRIINGVGFAVSNTVQISMAARWIPDERIGEGIGYIGMATVMGSAVAPAIGIWLGERYGMRMSFLSAALMAAAAFGLAYLLKTADPVRETADKKLSFHDFFAGEAVPFTIVYGTFSFVSGIISSYLVLYAQEMGIENIGIYFTVYALILVFVRPLSGKIMDRYGLAYTVFPGIILTICSMFLLGRSSTVLLILVSCVLRAAGQGAAQPSLQAGCIRRAGRERSGVATGTYYLGGDIAHGAGPMFGGWLLGMMSGGRAYCLLFDSCGVLLAAGLIYFIIMMKRQKAFRAE